MKAFILFGKSTCVVVWLWALSCLISPATPGSEIGVLVFWGLAIVHAIEVAVFFKTVKQTGDPMPLHLAQVFLFGFLHNLAMQEQLKTPKT